MAFLIQTKYFPVNCRVLLLFLRLLGFCIQNLIDVHRIFSQWIYFWPDYVRKRTLINVTYSRLSKFVFLFVCSCAVSVPCLRKRVFGYIFKMLVIVFLGLVQLAPRQFLGPKTFLYQCAKWHTSIRKGSFGPLFCT